MRAELSRARLATAAGECDACAKIAAGIHPDVVTLVREGAAKIVPIESVRTQVIARIGLPPHEAAGARVHRRGGDRDGAAGGERAA